MKGFLKSGPQEKALVRLVITPLVLLLLVCAAALPQFPLPSVEGFAGRWEIQAQFTGAPPMPLAIIEISLRGAQLSGKVIATQPPGMMLAVKEVSVKGEELFITLDLARPLTLRGKRASDRLEGVTEPDSFSWIGLLTTKDKLEPPQEAEDQKAFNAAIRDVSPQERRAALERFLKDYPNSNLKEMARFQLAMSVGDPNERQAALEQFLADFPESRFKDQARYQLATGIRDQEERLNALEKFIFDSPQSFQREQAFIQVLSTNLRRKPLEESRTTSLIDRYLASVPESQRLSNYNNIAGRLIANDVMLEKALELVEKAVAAINDQTPATTRSLYYTTRGEALYKRKEYDRAEESLKKAIEAGQAGSGEARLYLGKVYEARGNNDAALELYLTAVTTAYNNELKASLERTYTLKHGSLEGLHERIDAALLAQSKPFEPGRFARAPEDQGRVVLAELFTGSECGPCIAADLAFDGMLERYDRKAVAILEYHLHVPGPDPMTNSDSIERARYYSVRGTPTVVIDGIDRHTGGGSAEGARRNFELYKGKIEKRFEKAAPAEISALKFEREGDLLKISGKVETPADPPENARLRLALAEDIVHYTGGNGIHFHRFVVRKMLGSPEGIPIRAGTGDFEFAQSVDLNDVSAQVKAYLDDFEKAREGFRWRENPHPIKPREMIVVAFVQNDDTREVLQSAFLK